MYDTACLRLIVFASFLDMMKCLFTSVHITPACPWSRYVHDTAAVRFAVMVHSLGRTRVGRRIVRQLPNSWLIFLGGSLRKKPDVY